MMGIGRTNPTWIGLESANRVAGAKPQRTPGTGGNKVAVLLKDMSCDGISPLSRLTLQLGLMGQRRSLVRGLHRIHQ
jgi:hypothetical protein